MSENRWTAQQLDAISERGRNLLVAAAAGAGKTAVLVERIIRRITDPQSPVDIDRLLIVTFTSAAAAEMRERIGAAIARGLDENPGSPVLQRQLTLLSKSSITTIHSFCLEVIKNNFHMLDIDPNFRICDETEALLLKTEVLEELFEEKYGTGTEEPEFLHLVDCYSGGRDDRLLQDMVLKLYEFVQSHPWPEKWLRDNAEAYNPAGIRDFAQTKWAGILIDSAASEATGLIEGMRSAAELIRTAEGLEAYLPVFEEDILQLEALLRCCKKEGGCLWDELFTLVSCFGFRRLPNCGKNADKTAQENVKAVRDEVKKKIKRLREEIFTMPSEEISNDLLGLYPVMSALSKLTLEFGERFQGAKKDKALLDFNDLEHMCLRILTGEGGQDASDAAVNLRERFEEILVDEYQDSNLVQEVILNTISRRSCGTSNIFMVGDVKQSIYRFRQARPELFLEKYNSYPAVTGGDSRKILLYKNFRSRNEVVEGINFIFTQIMSRAVGELDYDDTEALNLGAEYLPLAGEEGSAGGPVELHLIDMAAEAETESAQADTDDISDIEEGGEEPLDGIQAEARVAAARIKELMERKGEGGFKVFDSKLRVYRDVEYRDIVILLRTTKNWSDIFMEEIGGQGIPVYADTGTGFFRTVEIQTIISLLQIIDNPLQDIPLLAVLRSPVGAFTTDELIEIRLAEKKAALYSAMEKLSDASGGETAKKCEAFLARLRKWRGKSLHTPTDEFLWYLYGDTAYYSYVAAVPGGPLRQANLRKLFEKARQYEETSYKGLFNFINFINKLKSGSGDFGSAKIMGENENVVRIMSIHKSKGLEFPVVFVSGCGKKFNMQDTNGRLLLHQELGFGPDFVDTERRIFYPTLPKLALREKIRLETLSEEMRVLYVAFTRAKEKLIITGVVKNIEKSASNWLNAACTGSFKLPEYEMRKCASYLGWIGPALIRHRDCESLRIKAAGAAKMGKDMAGDILEHPSSWTVRLWSLADAAGPNGADAPATMDINAWFADACTAKAEFADIGAEVNRRLGWKYPFEYTSTLPAKMSVTELKRRFPEGTVEEYRPEVLQVPPLVKKPLFLEEDRAFSAAEKGTILHFVLQHLELSRIRGVTEDRQLNEELGFQLGEMVFGRLLTQPEADVVELGRIKAFLLSPLGKRLLYASKVYRESAFNLEVASTDIYKEKEAGAHEEGILVQGVIDCFFEDKGHIVLIDYKTDFVAYGEAGIIRQRYKTQMDYYTLALERITGLTVGERYIYLFSSGEIVEFPG